MKQFGDFSKDETDYAQSAIAILPVPYDGTSTWIKGADRGPEALLDASYNLEFYDIETNSEVFRHGICTLLPVNENATPDRMAQAVEHRMDCILDDGKFPVVIGGEHSVSVGAVRSMARHYPDLTVLQFDAHSDMRDAYEGSPYNHACVMARVREVAKVTQVGIRSSATEEQHNIDPQRIFHAHRIKWGDLRDKWQQQVDAQLSDHVYVTIDLDALDPAYLPSTGTPEPDGLCYHDILSTVRLVAEHHTIVGFDIVELCPNPAARASDFLAAKMLYQILSIVFLHKQTNK